MLPDPLALANMLYMLIVVYTMVPAKYQLAIHMLKIPDNCQEIHLTIRKQYFEHWHKAARY